MAKNREPVKHHEEEDNSSEESDSGSEPEQELAKKSPPPPQLSTSEEDEEEEDEDSDEDSGGPEPNVKVKLTTKPIQDLLKQSEPVASEPIPASKSTSSKRPAGKESDEGKGSKKSKKEHVPVTPMSAASDSSKRVLFQRIWSDEDEIVILKGMIKYTAKKKSNPIADPDAFLNYIKKDLHIEVKKEQLLDKIRRLKKKYQTSKKKGRNFTKPHEKEMFVLSESIWGTVKGGDIAEASPKANGNVVKKIPSQKANILKNEEGEEFANEDSKEEKVLPPMRFRSNDLTLDERVLKIGAEVFEGVNVDEDGARKWRKLMIEEIEISIKEMDVRSARTKLVLDVLKSRNH